MHPTNCRYVFTPILSGLRWPGQTVMGSWPPALFKKGRRQRKGRERSFTSIQMLHTHNPFYAQLFHTQVWYTQLFHTQPFTGNFVTYNSFTHKTLTHTHTQTSTQISVTHTHTSLSHHLSSTISFFFPAFPITCSHFLCLLEKVDMGLSDPLYNSSQDILFVAKILVWNLKHGFRRIIYLIWLGKTLELCPSSLQSQRTSPSTSSRDSSWSLAGSCSAARSHGRCSEANPRNPPHPSRSSAIRASAPRSRPWWTRDERKVWCCCVSS